MVAEVVTRDTASGMGVGAGRVGIGRDGFEQAGGPVVGDAELRVRAGSHFLVVARADAGIDAETKPSVVAAFGESVDGILCTDRNRQLGPFIGQFDDPVEVRSGRVDGGVMDTLAAESGVERAEVSPADAHSMLASSPSSVSSTAFEVLAFAAK